MKRILLVVLLVTCATPTWSAVTLESLLNEMVDRESLARLPVVEYRCLQASSYDRAQKTAAEPKGWFANNDHEQFIRTEENDGRKEWVIMEHTGPGAITRFWLPLKPQNGNQIIRFYFDGATTPAIACKFNELLSGRGFVKPPFAFVAWHDTNVVHGVGGDMYLPIPFAKSCKITLDELPFYYIVNYRAYDAGTPVETFTMAGFEKSETTLKRVGEYLTTTPDYRHMAFNFGQQAVIEPGKDMVFDMPNGARAITRLQVQVDPQDAPQVLRSMVLSATFDGEPSIWCPLGEFFGTGARLKFVQDRYRSATEDGALTTSWVMPYGKSAQLVLRNLGSNAVTVRLSVITGDWKWDDHSMHFHATWRGQHELKTRPMSDWNFVDVKGRGVYVGDTLTVFSPVKAWYGEGDERVYIDGETFPSHIGTGTEDYYGYAWGMATFFSSPFISAPHRDKTDRGDWRGYTTTSRVRLLDQIPFRSAFKFDMEIWNWADTKMDYADGCFWYAQPGATCNRTPSPEEASQALSELKVPFRLKGAIECESLKITGKTADVPAEHQSHALPEGEWSGETQLFVHGKRVGDFVELEIPTRQTGKQRLTLYATKSWDYGVLRFSVNGEITGKDFDAFAPQAVLSGPIDLGVFEPRDGRYLLRVEVVGANPKSKGSQAYFGLDAVTLTAN